VGVSAVLASMPTLVWNAVTVVQTASISLKTEHAVYVAWLPKIAVILLIVQVLAFTMDLANL
jgi:hypothetical protein